MTKEQRQAATPLRWGFSTGTCMCALALASWFEHKHNSITALPFSPPPYVPVEFLDGHMRHIPLLKEKIHDMLALQKDGGDDPDCTHKAIFYGKLQMSHLHDAQPQDYILQVDKAHLIVRGRDGIGICTRLGFDCQQGKWAITTGPRNMLVQNLLAHGMRNGVWLFTFGVVQGEKIAKHSLNAHLGIEGGISILGTTGLVRPFSHEAYKATIDICVRSHHMEGGSSMVFCTGGRTQKGAKKILPQLPATAFTCIADFIAFSIQKACAYAMQEICIACMPGKLCKYAAGFENTHAHKVQQDMSILRAAVQKHLPQATTLHKALENSVTIREALLSIPDAARQEILHQLTQQALHQLAKFTTSTVNLRILVFDFQGNFLLEKSTHIHHAQNITAASVLIAEQNTWHRPPHTPSQEKAHMKPDYFLERK